jgi:toxin HigB-1
MIKSFRHKGLVQLFEEDSSRGINAAHERKIKQILGLLGAANSINDLNFTTFRLHALKGDLKNYWSMSVNGNWRIIFRFEDGNIFDVDLVDYH